MTLTLTAVALALLTIALLLEEWSWQRRVRQKAARRAVPPVRCLVCPGAPLVEDFRTHSRLAHQTRVVATEDDRSWA